MNVLDLVRADLRDFAGYRSARSDRLEGDIWLNANESPWANLADGDSCLRRYPDPQPARLRQSLADLYGCLPQQLLAGRGSDEGIDLLLRALCRPGGDAIVITTPTFGMYAVCARLHGVRILDVPLLENAPGYVCDFAAVAAMAEQQAAKIVFLCSPGNPGGNLLPMDEIAALTTRLRNRALVVVDEAYVEFSGTCSAVTLLDAHQNIVILRTLSKAHALAAARVGCVIGNAELIAVLQRCQAPYPLSVPSVEAALSGLSPAARGHTDERIALAIEERARMQASLMANPGIRRVFPSRGNFLLIRCNDAKSVSERLLAEGIVVRDLRAIPGLEDALRISIGTREQNDRVLAALGETVRRSEVAA